MGMVTDGTYRSKLKEDSIIGQKQSPLFIGRIGNRGYQPAEHISADSKAGSTRHITNVTRYITVGNEPPKRIGADSTTHRAVAYRPCSPTPAVVPTSHPELKEVQRKASAEIKRENAPVVEYRRYVRSDGTPVGSPVSPGRGAFSQPAHVESSARVPTRIDTGGGEVSTRISQAVRHVTGSESPSRTPTKRHMTGESALPQRLTVRTVTEGTNRSARTEETVTKRAVVESPTRGTVTTVIRRISGSPMGMSARSPHQAATHTVSPKQDLLPTFRQQSPPGSPGGVQYRFTRNTLSANESVSTGPESKTEKGVVRSVTTSQTPISRDQRSSTPSTATGGSEVRISLETRSKSPVQGASEKQQPAGITIKSRVSSPTSTKVVTIGRAAGGNYVRTYQTTSPTAESGSRSRPVNDAPAPFKRIVSKGGFEGGLANSEQPKERRKSTGCDTVKANRARVLSYDHRAVPVIDDAFAALVESFVGKPNLKPDVDANPTDGYDPFDGEQPVIPPSTHIMLPTSYVKRLQILDSPPRRQV